MNIQLKYSDHLIIPNGRLWEADEYLTFINDEIRNAVDKVVRKEGEEILYGADFRLFTLKEASSTEEVCGLLYDRLDYLLNKYPEFTIVSRVSFTEPYIEKDNPEKNGLVAMFIGNLAKNPRLLGE